MMFRWAGTSMNAVQRRMIVTSLARVGGMAIHKSTMTTHRVLAHELQWNMLAIQAIQHLLKI
jgi:hypothetical protein